jgi:hypothetical protein
LFNKLAGLEFAYNSLGQLFKIYIGLETGHYILNELLLGEVIELIDTLKPGKKIGLPIISTLVNKIDINPLHFSVLFKTNQVFHFNDVESVSDNLRSIQTLPRYSLFIFTAVADIMICYYFILHNRKAFIPFAVFYDRQLYNPTTTCLK